ncbi:hypothetical protein Moror_13391 [Moniliophthora roreri MCA 2997]|uniref:Tf2-1-like SH3-like domain-containing protein n=1 Tax=Moniliophthora roreri (strain MCA 2997) TaxID=1381753 RepID=V2WKJ1_MONRO|nr:hypothetical protein Moror_13391 [Moniliophthora roreri MCA 2997]
MIMGYHPRPLPTAFEKTSVPSVKERLNRLRRLWGEVMGMMDIVRQKMIEREKRGMDKFEEGQKVWLEGKNLDFGYPNKKLSPKREGPFVIKKVMGPVMYKLKLPDQWRIHPIFHAGLLKPYKETEAHGWNFVEPPPDIVEGHEEFEIEAIIGHNNALRNTSLGQPHLQFAIDGLIRLQAQRASLNAIIEETNVYAANLAFNATTSGPAPLRLEGPMTVPSFPINSEQLEFQLYAQLSGLGPLPTDICDANPNDPAFIQATETYRARIGAAVELACDQN